MKLVPLVILAALSMSYSSSQAQEIAYHIGWGAPNGHFFDVEMRFANPEQGPVSVRIPAWRPGRYIIQNYAKNIIRFSAADDQGNALNFRKTDKSTWQIDAEAGQQVVVKYQAYADDDDGGGSYIDEREAYINPITLCMYIPGHEMTPTSLTVQQPAGWKTATQLIFDDSRHAYLSPNYHELVDGPLIMSPTLEMHSFEFAGATFDVAVQGQVDLDWQKLLQDLQKLVEVESNIMGVIPFDHYVFLVEFVDRKFGHGVEHKNSSELVLGPSTDPGLYGRILSLSAHEFFHVWNVERIRPEAIYHPDYSKEQYTTTMWIYEGITSYYASVALRRAGLISEDAFLARLEGPIKGFEDAYAKSFTSIAMSSWDSWTKGYGAAPPNTFYSFYTAGAVVGLLLDMEVRGRTRDLQSLDNVMQYLYQNYAARDRGVPENGLQTAIETITNGTMQPFFDDYIFGTKPIDYDRYLFFAGYRLEKGTDPNEPEVTLGIDMKNETGDVVIASVRPESSAFDAGLDIDDVLIAIDGHRLDVSNLNTMLAQHKPGDTVSITYFRRNELKTAKVVLKAGGNTTYKLVRLPNTTLLQNETRRAWMNLAAG